MAARENDFDVAVVGAGVVGLAIGAELSARWPRVVVFERHTRAGTEISSRNSEVVHGGLYYPTDSLKARCCVEGRRMLYRFADEAGVPYRKVGKIVVATDADEAASLEALLAKGAANGVEGLNMLTERQVCEREPAVAARAGLLSRETGVIDSHALLRALYAAIRERGGNVVFGAEVRRLELESGSWHVGYRDADGEGSVTARTVVNAAGLEAQTVMRIAGLDPVRLGVQRYLCKGQYFDVRGELNGSVRGLVYPSPDVDLAGLGIHTVVDLSGRLRLGPDARYVDEIDYSTDAGLSSSFHRSVQRFLPSIRAKDLTPAMCGIRPKLAGPGEPGRDFYIGNEHSNGAPGFINLAGIESPGLTACLAIGARVAHMVGSYLAD